VRLVFLGTGTSYGVPQIGCDCRTCISSDPRDRRTRTAALIESGGRRLLIDTPPSCGCSSSRPASGPSTPCCSLTPMPTTSTASTTCAPSPRANGPARGVRRGGHARRAGAPLRVHLRWRTRPAGHEQTGAGGAAPRARPRSRDRGDAGPRPGPAARRALGARLPRRTDCLPHRREGHSRGGRSPGWRGSRCSC